MILDDLATYLISNGISNVYKATMPDAPDDAVCLYEYGGNAPVFTHDGVAYTNPGLQVMVRGRNYGAVRAIIEAIFNLLKGIVNQAIGTGQYLRISPNQSPFPLGLDANGRHQLVVNFSVSIGG